MMIAALIMVSGVALFFYIMWSHECLRGDQFEELLLKPERPTLKRRYEEVSRALAAMTIERNQWRSAWMKGRKNEPSLPNELMGCLKAVDREGGK